MATASAAFAGDSPTGWWYGTDSARPGPTGSNPYQEPDVGGGDYGAYFGQIGAWWQLESGCSYPATDFQTSYANDANSNFKSSQGLGAGAYFYVGGPSEDPTYNGTDSEAYDWGWNQAEQAAHDYSNTYSSYIDVPVLFMDMEWGNGWNHHWNNHCGPCSSSICSYSSANTSPNLDRCTFNGFWDYFNVGTKQSCSLSAPSTLLRPSAAVSTHSLVVPVARPTSPRVTCCGGGRGTLYAGTYSSSDYWNAVFEVNGSLTQYGEIPGTYEWTFSPGTGFEQVSSANRPTGFAMTYDSTEGVETNDDDSPDFFGGQDISSSHALVWQWAGVVSGDPSNPYGDFDQINANNLP